MNPIIDGLPSTRTYKGQDGDEMLLLNGIENATHAIRRGRTVTAHAYNTYRKLIMRVRGLEDALDHREEMQGGNDD